MVVVEDPRTGAVTIKVTISVHPLFFGLFSFFIHTQQVTESIMIKSITAGAGSIAVGDKLVMIENDDITGMPLLRGSYLIIKPDSLLHIHLHRSYSKDQ